MSKINKSHSVKKNLTEWLSYLENIHSIEIDLGLRRISQVAQTLNISFPHSKVITVAGTNGKGTTCAFLENAFLAQNKTCAVYSSPHIEKFNERLRINRLDIDDNALIMAFEKIESARGDISLSYYEYTTLAAFVILMLERPDVVILEVGLGGRLDATNIVDTDLAVITTIDLDHQGFLGDTREAIGYEKAGIMRANTPVVIGDINPPSSLTAYAKTSGAVAYIRKQHFTIETASNGLWSWTSTCPETNANKAYNDLSCSHIPQDNIATAIMVLNILAEDLSLTLNTAFINNIIENTKVPGRIEKFIGNSDIILDVAHNPQAARYLATQLREMKYTHIYAVVGMLLDKDIENTITPLTSHVDKWFFGTLDAYRGCEAKKLAEVAPIDRHKVNCFDNVTQAFRIATQNAKKNDLILVFGSFYTVAEIRRLLVTS